MSSGGWADLSKDLLSLIAEKLQTRINILRLRSVCASWRSSIPPFCGSPPLSISPFCTINQKSPHESSLLLCQSTIYRLSSLASDSNPDKSGSWLLRIEETIFERTRVENPLSSRSVRTLHYGFPKVLNLLDFHVAELCKVYKSRHIPLRSSFIGVHLSRVALSSRPNSSTGEYVVLGILRPGGHLCSNLLGDGNWSVVREHIHDVIHFNEKFYAVDSSSRLFVWEELSLQLIEVIGPAMVGDGIFQMTSDGISGYFRLVKSSGDLFLVYGKPNGNSCCSSRHGDSSSMCEGADFRFFKLNQELRAFEEVNSIGDQVFFLGDDCSFSVSTRELTGLEPYCLYFVNDSVPFGINKFNIDCDGKI